MDWKKAIRILIISFVVLNIALLINLYIRKKPTAKQVTKNEAYDEIYDIEEILDSRDIKIETEVPQDGRCQCFLEVEHESIDKDLYENLFFGGETPQIRQDPDKITYIKGQRQLDIANNGVITYSNKSEGQDVKRNITEDEAVESAAKFIKRHGGLPKDAVLNNVVYDEKTGDYHVEFVREYDGFLLVNSYIKVIINSNQIKNFERCWLVPLNYHGEEKDVVSPFTAILRAADEKQGLKTIAFIKQGFYSKLYNANSWQMAPIWIIGFEDGKRYYVNSYTGQLER